MRARMHLSYRYICRAKPQSLPNTFVALYVKVSAGVLFPEQAQCRLWALSNAALAEQSRNCTRWSESPAMQGNAVARLGDTAAFWKKCSCPPDHVTSNTWTRPSENDRSKVDVITHVFGNFSYPIAHSVEAHCRGTFVGGLNKKGLSDIF